MINKLLNRVEELTDCSKRELVGGLTNDIKSCDCLNCLVCRETIARDLVKIRRMIEEQLKATSDTSSDTLSETRKELDKCIITIEQKS